MKKNIEQKKIEVNIGTTNSQTNIAANNTQMERLNASQGHGFAVERANHLVDTIQGRKAEILGDDNAKNGADRRVDGICIQSKYCQTASNTISAAFDKGQYRYMNSDGTPMQLEVPSDQYADAVLLMEKRIAKGEVPGITDVSKAKEIVREGHFTYAQSQRLAQAETIESLVYDSATGSVIAANAFVITATIAFGLACWNGQDLDVALENAVASGIHVGGATFVSNIAVNQLTRTGLNKSLVPLTDKAVQLIGKDSAQTLSNALQLNANVYGSTAMCNVSKLLRSNAISAVVMTLVLSANDIKHLFTGHMSMSQCLKNLSITTGGLAGGTVGATIGTAVAGPIGSVVGGFVGGVIGGKGVSSLANNFVKDDAERMLEIIQSNFVDYAEQAVMTTEEVELSLGNLVREIDNQVLLSMYKSADKEQFTHELIKRVTDNILGFRSHIVLPDIHEWEKIIVVLGDNYINQSGIFKQAHNVDPVLIGQQLTGKKYSEQASKMAWYATKQMNRAGQSIDYSLHKMKANNKACAESIKSISDEIAVKKQFFDEVFK